MAVTIKDVAALAGVSPSTVSRTCQDHPAISPQTKEKVRQAMKELGYEPNFQASNLASQNTRTIGIVLPPSEDDAYENSIYLEIIRGISQICNERHYINTILTGRDDEELLEGIQTMIRRGQADGFIVLYSREKDPVISHLHDAGQLYVLIGKANEYANETIYIDNDNVLAGKEAAEHLLSLGHRRIGFLARDLSMYFASDRGTGYISALFAHSISMAARYYIELKDTSGEEYEQLVELLSLPKEERLTGLVVCDDILALLVKNLCDQLSLRVPEDISIISFNNSLLARMSTPSLVSIDINARRLGIEAAVQLISHVESPDLPATKIIVPHTLIERESCAAPPESFCPIF